MTETSAQRKLGRGAKQIKALFEETDAYCDADAYVFETKRERRAPNEVVCRCYSIERTAPSDEWPLVAGEAIQNVRAALDHSVWAAWRSVRKNTGDGGHTQFIISNDPDGFSRQAWRLKGVPAPVRELMERSQPYNRWPEAPERDTLAILRDLSNADKHRALAVVACAVSFEMVGVGQGVTIENWHVASGKRLGHDTTEVSSFIAVSDGQSDPMGVAPDFSYDVRIEGYPLGILKGVVHAVFEIVTECETGSPPNPFAPYPL
jgi:hypothetical protein